MYCVLAIVTCGYNQTTLFTTASYSKEELVPKQKEISTKPARDASAGGCCFCPSFCLALHMPTPGVSLAALAGATVRGPWPATRTVRADTLWKGDRPTVVYAVRRLG